MLSKNKIKYIHSLELKKTRKEEQVFPYLPLKSYLILPLPYVLILIFIYY